MALGEGKGWSRGRTAATDERIARNAESHRGRTYLRRTPVQLCRWTKPRATIQPEWSDTTAYVVGLIATDGCLIDSSDQRRIDFVSAELPMIQTYTSLVGIPGRFRICRSPEGGISYRTCFKHADFYSWLLRIGLTPRKSLTLGPIDVPPALLSHLVRGLLDGDGSIINHVTRADMTRRPLADYRYEWLKVRFVSAGQRHLRWLHEELKGAADIRGGWIHETIREDGHRCSALTFGRRDSMILLTWIYSSPNLPCLQRKRAIWLDYLARHRDPASGFGRWRGTGGRYGRPRKVAGRA